MPKPESRGRGRAVLLAIWFLIVFVIATTMPFWPRNIWSVMRNMGLGTNRIFPAYPGIALALSIPLIFAVSFLAVAIHESGHVAAGMLVGFHFNSLRIGRIQFDRPFRISLYRGRGTGSGGWASLFPVKQDKLILRAIVMLLAGPFSNLISAGLVYALPYPKGMLSACFLFVSALLGLMNLVPFRNRGVFSDGGRILMLLQNRARGERWLAMLKLLEEMRQGVPRENLSPEFLAKAIAVQDNSPDTFTANALAYAAAFWQRKDDEAAQALEACLRCSNLVGQSQRQGIMVDATIFQARRRKRIDLAEQWLADVPQKTEYPWLRSRGEAAILEAKGDNSEAIKKLDEVEKMILATPNQALREMSLQGVRRWRAELA